MSNHLLDDFLVKPCLAKRMHGHPVGATKPLHLGKIRGQIIGHSASPMSTFVSEKVLDYS